MLGFRAFQDGPDRGNLVVATADVFVDQLHGEWPAALAALHHPLEIRSRRKAVDLLGRIEVGIPEVGFIPVRIENEWNWAAVNFLQIARVGVRLLLAQFGILARALGLNHGYRLAVKQERVVGKLMAFVWVWRIRAYRDACLSKVDIQFLDDQGRIQHVPARQ